MASYNKVLLMGNLTREPELRHTPSNMAVTQIGIAVNRKWKNQNGEPQEEVTFVDCEAWGRTAEVIHQYFHKGNPIFIEGRLRLDQWQDKNSGEKRSKMKVVIESFQFVDSKSDRQGGGGGGGGYDEGYNSAPAPSRGGARQPQRQAPPPGPEINEPDIPF